MAEPTMIAARCELDEATVRVEQLFWIPSLTSGAAPTREFADFCRDMPDDRGHPLYRAVPALLNSLDEEDFDPDFVVEDLFQSGVSGFLVQGATPFFAYHKDGRSHHYSWGHYYTDWLYAASEADIPSVLAAWAETRHEKDKADALSLPLHEGSGE